MPPWALISGTKGSGKSGLAAELAATLAARGLRLAGFVQDAILDGEVRTGYRLRRLATGESIGLARGGVVQEPAREELVCSYVFDLVAFARARAWLAADLAAAHVVVLDEVARLESSGRGHHAALVDALAGAAPVVLSVRADELAAVMDRFGLDEPFAALEVDGPAAGARAALPAFAEAVYRQAAPA